MHSICNALSIAPLNGVVNPLTSLTYTHTNTKLNIVNNFNLVLLVKLNIYKKCYARLGCRPWISHARHDDPIIRLRQLTNSPNIMHIRPS